MRNLFFNLLLFSVAGTLTACEDKSPAPAVESVSLISAQVSSDPDRSYYDFSRARASVNVLPTIGQGGHRGQRPVFEFTINASELNNPGVQTVEVYKSFQRGEYGDIGPRVLVGSYSSLPATIALNSQDAITGLKRASTDPNTGSVTLHDVKASNNSQMNPIVPSDRVIFTFECINANHQRTILTPLKEVRLADGSSYQAISGTQASAPYAVIAPFYIR